MKIKIALNPFQEYVYPVMNSDGIRITQHVSYGGDDSESVPCGFVTQMVYERVVRKKKKSNEFKDGYTKEMRYIQKRLDKANLVHVKAGSLTKKPNG